MKQLLNNISAILTPLERRRAYLLIFFDAMVSILDILALVILLFIINFYTQPLSKAPVSFLPAALLNNNSLLLIGVFFIPFCLKNIFAYGVQRAQYQFIYAVASRLSEKKLLQYLEGSFPDYVTVDSSVYIRSISQQPVEFSQYILAGIQQIFTQLFLIVITIIAILLFNAKLFLLVMLLLVPTVLFIALLIKKRTRMARMQVRNSGEKTLQHIKEALAGYIESNIYGKNSFFTKRYSHYQQTLNKHLSELQVVQGIPGRMLEVFAVLSFFILLIISKWGMSSATSSLPAGGLNLLTIGMFMAAAYKIMPGVIKILNCSGQIRTYDYTIQDLLPVETMVAPESKMDKPISIESLEFSHLGFNFDHKKILSDFSQVIKKNDFIGISGNSGIGKTTLVNLLLGFLAPAEGALLINNKIVETKSLKQYWPAIAYVKQSTFLMNDSILNNITLDEGGSDIEKLHMVIKATGLEEALGGYPEGLHKLISENGKNISGGQRQRIVIARALYKDADLIILDEPFNELDRQSENIFLHYFASLAKQGKIILLITHNKESLSFCDKIITLDEG